MNLHEILTEAKRLGEKCITCGSSVGIYSSGEGTNSYGPINISTVEEQVGKLVEALRFYAGEFHCGTDKPIAELAEIWMDDDGRITKEKPFGERARQALVAAGYGGEVLPGYVCEACGDPTGSSHKYCTQHAKDGG